MKELLELLRREPAYRKLAAANFVSGLGDWFSSVAILGLLLQITGSGMAVGITLAARTLPYLVMGPIGGVLADKGGKKTLLIVSDFSRIALALSLLLVDSPDRVWIAYAATVGLVIFSALALPARQSLIPRIVRRENLPAANALDQTLGGMNMTLGAVLGGAASAAFGPQLSFLFNAATFLASGLLVCTLPYGRGRKPDGSGVKGAGRKSRPAADGPGVASAESAAADAGQARLAAGANAAQDPLASAAANAENEADASAFWRTFRRSMLMKVVAVQSIAWPIGGGAINVLISVYGYQVFGGGDRGVGLLYGSLGVGFVLGGLLAPSFKRWPVQALILGAAAEGLAHVGVSAAPSLLPAAACIMLATLGGGVGNTALTTLIMRAVPENVHGRAFALNETLANVTMGVSMLVAGLLLDVLPARTIGLIAGLMIVASCIPALALLRQRRTLNSEAAGQGGGRLAQAGGEAS
ncbi:MFS transporter [Saccharibacillus sp. CPCC 101409]|uniref:MFS transporter n=1 Tax=Saccharibacillus sp. CPCC 101409 TaxID=3058041 RepID=UPI002670F3C8|nr:MFS transporter [Saccharibacillus sp. CPCC 101409]MDO3408159.1 MFS transporter [Saccharibacillus sp. CPCC 101409]